MEPTANRPAHRAFVAAWFILLAVLVACASEVEPPTPTPTAEPEAEFVPTRAPFAATQTAEAQRAPYVIERVTLATDVDRNGVPQQEVSTVPADTRSMFLSILVSELEPPTRFRAFWLEGERILAQSEQVVEETDGSPRWVSLGFQAQEDLNPSLPHAVELRINDVLVDTYSFRVGIGNFEDIISDLTVALGTDEEGEPVGGGDLFDSQAPQIVAVVRVSSKVDPTGMIFTAFLVRDGDVIQHSSPDGGQPQLPEDPTPLDRQITFTFFPDPVFEPGEYSMRILINGVDAAEQPFDIIDEQVPAPTPTAEATAPPTPSPTATPTGSTASLVETRITEQLDEDTGEPTEEGITEWVGNPNQRATVYLSVLVDDLHLDDVIEVDSLLDGQHVNRRAFPRAAFDRGWLTVPVNIWAPPENGALKRYTFLIFINGDRVREVTLLVDNNAPPAATATATDDDDDEDEDED